jgi:peroxiredoxin
MLRLLVLIFTFAPYAYSQAPEDLLRSAQEAYKSPEGYEIKGRGSVQPQGSSWRMDFDETIAAEPDRSGSTEASTAPGRRGVAIKVGSGRIVNPDGVKDAPLVPIAIPFSVTGGWTRIAENVMTVRESGVETLSLNGSPVACRILRVDYKFPMDSPKPAPVAYSICSEKHLVLKKTMEYTIDRKLTGPAARWTITFDTSHFNVPAPQWILHLDNVPSLTVRKEWIGKKAPTFRLSDLDGISVDLASMRGKVVLLDFWSIDCGPCLREIPMIESVEDSHRQDVSLWGIAFDPPAKDKKWLSMHQHSLPTLTDADFVVSDLYRVHGIPALVLIGRDGKIKNYWAGEVPRTELEAAIERASRH